VTGITLGSFLFDQLWARGVRHIFGIPGDFVLNLYEAAVEIQSNDCVAPAYYATMGFAVPAALGLQVSSGRRPLVLR
jgi:thiamine pyrophosphate-dependent acetolactate synthase large subunit-like protein